MFTAQQIKSLKVDKKTEVMEGAGFGIRATPTGSKVWIYRYRYNGKLKRMSLGSYPAMSLADARQAYLTAKARHKDGREPQGGTDTVEDFAKVFMQRHSKVKKKSWQIDQQMLDRDILPMIGTMKMSKVRKRDILSILDAITDRGAPIMANRTLATIRKMFAYAVERDVLEYSVVTAIRPPHKERSVERVLTPDEIQTLMHAEGVWYEVMRLMLLTGQRKGEVLQMRYQDLERDLWTIPGEFTKNGKAHMVPLVPEVWPIIDRQESPNDYVFQIKGSTVSQFCARRKLGYTPHDVRRTVATGLAEMGVQRVVISKLLNHADPSITAVYDRYTYQDEMREALGQWAEKVVI